MEIERINENTVKFYISYIDIEDRGFEREEIWYNRERSEQLFWQMMDEVNIKEDFNAEGPLWIQIQALEKGLEVLVTKAQISKSGESLELPTEDGTIDITVDDKIEHILEQKIDKGNNKDNYDYEENFWIIVKFSEFEDVIQLSHSFIDVTDPLLDRLYVYENEYYLYLEFIEDITDEDRQEDLISRVFEYADDCDLTFYMLDEYGTKIFESDTFAQIRSHFPAEV
ncbi:MAG TPA: adaptor protein MecA [Bacillota bacterium]|nr:adaptor protein MecA [Bacillota bacterium]